MPPGDDDEDEEGRFFGGGISKQESEIPDFVEGANGDGVNEKRDAAWLRKTALNFEKCITKNAELRAKFESEPQKFISSEADLDTYIRSLAVLSEHPELYQELVRLGCAGSLVGLLAHDNTDIAIGVIEVIGELTDEDILAEDEQWNHLVDALTEADLLDLLVSNFSRLDESDESDRNGVYYSLRVLENLCSRPQVATRIGQDKRLLCWLLGRAAQDEAVVTQNKQYAAELLAILSQATPESRLSLVENSAIDTLLQLAAAYRRRDPDRGGEEEEYMENLFESLTCLVDETEGKPEFIRAEGVELCLLILKDGKMSRAPALRLLDHAAAGKSAGGVCQKLVEAGGLKSTFTLFMKSQDHRLLGHCLAIFSSMLRLLPTDSAARIRMLAKFVEKDYIKIAKLTELRQEYDAQIRHADEQHKVERQAGSSGAEDELELGLYTKRLAAGLHTLQTIDEILAWLVAEDSGAKRKINFLLGQSGQTLAVVRKTLTEYMEGTDATELEGQNVRDILGTLVELLQC